MIPAETPEKLIEVCTKIKRKGAEGCLISGGCLPDGSVPIPKFIDAIAEIKKILGLTIVTHTGLIDIRTSKMLKEAGVDAVSIDILGSDQTIKGIYNLSASIVDYEQSLRALSESEIPFIPHVLVGLHYGKLKGEFKAMRLIAKYNPSALIVIVFFQIPGTQMERIMSISPKKIADILIQARLMMPKVPLILGCARPKGIHRKQIDIMGIEAGVNGIVFPHVKAIEKAQELGMKMFFLEGCCALIYRDIRL
jgi:uncharacterized radical SAM superfamily protein